MQTMRIATRGSQLALWQARHIQGRLEERYPGLRVELVVIKTRGDKILDVPLAKVGGKGLFVKEIEDALLAGAADMAVHSMKDVPAELPQGLKIGVIPQREQPTDTLLSVHYAGLDALPSGARVGTSSLRRQTQLLAVRPDLNVVSLRGNLDTRVRKLHEGAFDAIVVATAGLRRLGLSAPHAEELAPPRFYPAVAQGALGIEYRTDRPDLDELLGFLDHPASRVCVEAERAFLFALDGGCQVPIAGHALLDDAGRTVHLTGLVADLSGETIIVRSGTAKLKDAAALGASVAQEVLGAGGRAILEAVYRQDA
ncbi:porphobilinogen deaminase [Thermodesulfomicrobium sp. WS]|uniref:hydroxymethylbilane synthase n=1 Tax=Thermodesulfomicrobium sp. WS TaxID=3004129 RepID=UPI00248FB1C8|nr:hydroxymethylbilane synthase [Thermodesulfomicrobium sp. WS]BDV00669.1 porphobilinogen deaminase [Thermodesulfomicrobium sp. WS]